MSNTSTEGQVGPRRRDALTFALVSIQSLCAWYCKRYRNINIVELQQFVGLRRQNEASKAKRTFFLGW